MGKTGDQTTSAMRGAQKALIVHSTGLPHTTLPTVASGAALSIRETRLLYNPGMPKGIRRDQRVKSTSRHL